MEPYAPHAFFAVDLPDEVRVPDALHRRLRVLRTLAVDASGIRRRRWCTGPSATGRTVGLGRDVAAGFRVLPLERDASQACPPRRRRLARLQLPARDPRAADAGRAHHPEALAKRSDHGRLSLRDAARE